MEFIEVYNNMIRKLKEPITEMGYKSGVRMTAKVAKALADEVKAILVDEGVNSSIIEYGGSMRRQELTVGDVDIIVFDDTITVELWEKVVTAMKAKGHKIAQEYTDPNGKVRDMQMGSSQASFLVEVEGLMQNVDLKKYSPEKRGSMMIHATGSKDFNIGMRAWLKSFGWGFSQNGLTNEKGEILSAKDEHEIFDRLGMSYIEPKDRVSFPTPKRLPQGAPPPGSRREQSVAPSATPVPVDVMARVPADVKQKLLSFKLPEIDEQGNPIPSDFMWNPTARHLYYKRRGAYRLPKEFKLDQYQGLDVI